MSESNPRELRFWEILRTTIVAYNERMRTHLVPNELDLANPHHQIVAATAYYHSLDPLYTREGQYVSIHPSIKFTKDEQGAITQLHLSVSDQPSNAVDMVQRRIYGDLGVAVTGFIEKRHNGTASFTIEPPQLETFFKNLGDIVHHQRKIEMNAPSLEKLRNEQVRVQIEREGR